jgi:succinylglutamic semialdehyde dehydrogenase
MTGFQSIDPATGGVVWEGLEASRDEVHAAVAKARAAAPGWARTPLIERIERVRAFAAALEARKAALAETISRETGKPLWESLGEVGTMIGKVELSIRANAERTGERKEPTAFGAAVLRHRPHGVMAVFGPYNFPGHLPNGHIVPALLAGNTVVFKPSELTPATGAAIAQAWADAGLPEGVFQIAQGGRDTGAALAEADIDGLLFTGSAATGGHFRRMFADRPHVILALELGGNNPLIAWDGDIEEAAAVVVQSAFITSGQRCSCARRLIVPEGVFGDALVAEIKGIAAALPIGAWDETPEPWIGPLVSDRAADGARAQVATLLTRGAQEILPFAPIGNRRSAFVSPAIFDVTGIAVPDEEIFAPVLQVTRVPDFDAALAAANATRFGLSAGLISADDALWERFLDTVRAGVVNRNRPTTGASGGMPFGGLGDSGNHRPSAYYAADYCAYPVASFEAASAEGNLAVIAKALGR